MSARYLRLSILGMLLALGCAPPATQTRQPEWQEPLEAQAKAQNRLDLRLEEVTRNLLVLRDRVEALEVILKERETARAEAAPPSLKVVKLEPKPVQSPAPASAPADAQAADLYRTAFNAFRERRFGQAILDFEGFLRKHADHEYADNAQYWIGESYYSQGEYEQSVVEFNRVLERYPQEAKAPDALLKIGLAYEKLGQPDRAKVFWDRLVSLYPHSEAALEATQRLQAAQ